jgi:membrane-associated phospholipid phosphatase
VHAYRVFCLAIAADYLLSLAFFLFFPVPERWAFPDSGAVLLSDRWSSSLIAFLRPISGLDNSFPSTHVSFTVVIVLVAYLFRLRLRHTMMVLSATIVLSTFALGIHWIPDILAGLAVGTLSVALARRLTPLQPGETGHERTRPELAST